VRWVGVHAGKLVGRDGGDGFEWCILGGCLLRERIVQRGLGWKRHSVDRRFDQRHGDKRHGDRRRDVERDVDQRCGYERGRGHGIHQQQRLGHYGRLERYDRRPPARYVLVGPGLSKRDVLA
jgi:hypothetical protein